MFYITRGYENDGIVKNFVENAYGYSFCWEGVLVTKTRSFGFSPGFH